MKFQDKDLAHCMLKAKELSEHYMTYALAADSPERSVDLLKEMCARYCAKTVKLEELDIQKDDTTVWGACFALEAENQYDIAYVAGLNYCWKRFVICKELFHAVLETQGHHNLNIEAHVEEVTLSFPVDDLEPSEAVKSEFLTEITAMQFLFPYCERIKELDGLAAGNFNFRAIAEKYKVPQILVERYLSKHYMEVFKEFCN